MKKVTVKELMRFERILLEINTKHRFELDFEDAYKLYQYLKEIGNMTNYVFLLQDDFHRENNDVDKLKSYHVRLMNSEIDFECCYDALIEFIEKLINKIDNEELTKKFEDLKFW